MQRSDNPTARLEVFGTGSKTWMDGPSLPSLLAHARACVCKMFCLCCFVSKIRETDAIVCLDDDACAFVARRRIFFGLA